MGLLDTIKNKFKKKEKEEPLTEVEPEALPSGDPYNEVEPTQTTEPAPIPEALPEPAPDLQLQQPIEPTPSDSEIKNKLEIINSKLDTLKAQIENLNNSITVINAKIK